MLLGLWEETGGKAGGGTVCRQLCVRTTQSGGDKDSTILRVYRVLPDVVQHILIRSTGFFKTGTCTQTL